MRHNPAFNATKQAAKLRKQRIDAIMSNEPITLPFLKSKPSLWQRIKNKLNK